MLMDEYYRQWQQFYRDSGYGPEMNPYMQMRLAEKKCLKRLSVTAGLCVVGFVVIQYAFAFALALSGKYDAYLANEELQWVFGIVSYAAGTFLPFLAAYRLMNDRERESAMPFSRPVSGAMLPIAVVAGLLACTIGNYASNYISYFFELAGYEITTGETVISTSAGGLFIDVLQIAALPALVEEFALRGVIMQPLRRYGDWFAIVMSSVVFALMHGNMIQIPFAFIVGIALGYLVITTGSIWTGVIIHFLNNVYSVIITYLLEVNPTLAEKVYSINSAVTLIAGIACIAIYLFVGKKNKLVAPATMLTTGEKVRTYIFTVPMLIAVVILVIQTVSYLQAAG